MVTKSMDAADRKAKLLDAGAKLAQRYGAINVTRRMVAQAAKVSDALVAHYMGSAKDAQSAYRRHMRKLGLVEPPKDKIEAMGIKLRAKGPRTVKSTRKRSTKEIEAIRRKIAKKEIVVPKTRAKAKPKSPDNGIGKKVVGVVIDDPLPKVKDKGKAPENKDKGKAPENKAARMPLPPPPGVSAEG